MKWPQVILYSLTCQNVVATSNYYIAGCCNISSDLFFSVRILPQTYWPILPDNLGCINKLHCIFQTFGETAYLIRPVQVWFLVAQPQKRGECSTIKQPGCKAEEVHQTREATGVWNQHDHGNKCLSRIRRTKTRLNKIYLQKENNKYNEKVKSV